MKCFRFNVFFIVIFSLFMILPRAMACEQKASDHCHQTAKKKTKETNKNECRSCCQTLLTLSTEMMTLTTPEVYLLSVQFNYISMALKAYAEPELRPPIS